ncbi:hypothetical protein [Pseudoduganella violaceinigra]|uniref:hypothetical protein n=1 Tax=Pseudoduganella violaceinigra TaxID=246602 RepID=UPI0004847E6A|nr:hypothetical protein [Pseudoduganella violaceinigra]
MKEPTVYLDKMAEARTRLAACESYASVFGQSQDLIALESAALQLRKAMEAIALAAIAPNKKQYADFRQLAVKSPDFRKDYQADTIFLTISNFNPDFYPDPIQGPVQASSGHWHFERRGPDYLKKDQFVSLYKRLGKFLHADNPWGGDKGWVNLAKDLPQAVPKLRNLLLKHRTVIRAEDFSGVWVVDVPGDGSPPQMFQARAAGSFVVEKPI